MKTSVEKIKTMLEEDYELSSAAKKEFVEARKTPTSKYISQNYEILWHPKVLKKLERLPKNIHRQ